MAYLEETGRGVPNQPLLPQDLFQMVGNVSIAKQELSGHHLHICDYHVGIWRYVPLLQLLYSRVNFLLLLVRRLTINVLLVQDGITRAQTEAQACACRCHLCYYKAARFAGRKACIRLFNRNLSVLLVRRLTVKVSQDGL